MKSLAPDVRDLKALATVLKMHSAFEAVDRLARDWIEQGKRNLRPEDMESDEKRDWYELSDRWDSAVSTLKQKVSSFEKEYGASPILAYIPQPNGATVGWRIFLGYDSRRMYPSSVQARGFRMLQFNELPVWFEELQSQQPEIFRSENLSEDEVYDLSPPAERLKSEELFVLRDDFLKDLVEAGVPAYTLKGEVQVANLGFIERFNKVVNKRLNYNENIRLLEPLVEQIKREHALVVRPAPGRLAVGPPVSPITNVVPIFAPETGRRLDDWYLMFVPYPDRYRFMLHYLYRGSWDNKGFQTLEEARDFLAQGRGRLYLHAYRGEEDAVWSYPVPITPFKIREVNRQWENYEADGRHLYHLQQPTWNGIQWIWRLTNVFQWGNIQRQLDVEAAESELLNNKYGYVTPQKEPLPTAAKPEIKEVLVSFREMYKVGPPEPPLKVGDKLFANGVLYGTIKNIEPMGERDQTPVYVVEMPNGETKKLHYSYVAANKMTVERIPELIKTVSVEDKIENYFSSGKVKPLPISAFTINLEVKAYSSHGEWSTLRGIRELEKERGNEFPDLRGFAWDTPALWVTFDKRMDLRYLEDADQWERLMSDSPLTSQDIALMNEITEVTLSPSDIVAWTDFDRGYLILRTAAALEVAQSELLKEVLKREDQLKKTIALRDQMKQQGHETEVSRYNEEIKLLLADLEALNLRLGELPKGVVEAETVRMLQEQFKKYMWEERAHVRGKPLAEDDILFNMPYRDQEPESIEHLRERLTKDGFDLGPLQILLNGMVKKQVIFEPKPGFYTWFEREPTEEEEKANVEVEKEELQEREIPQEPDQTVYVVILVSGGVEADDKGTMKVQTPEFVVEATTKEEFAKYGDFNSEIWLRPLAGMFGVPMLDEVLKAGEIEYDAIEDNALTWGNDWDAIREQLADNPPPFNKYAVFHVKWRPEDLHWTKTAADTHDVYHYKYSRADLERESKHELQVIAKVKDLSTSGEAEDLIVRIVGEIPSVSTKEQQCAGGACLLPGAYERFNLPVPELPKEGFGRPIVAVRRCINKTTQELISQEYYCDICAAELESGVYPGGSVFPGQWPVDDEQGYICQRTWLPRGEERVKELIARLTPAPSIKLTYEQLSEYVKQRLWSSGLFTEEESSPANSNSEAARVLAQAWSQSNSQQFADSLIDAKIESRKEKKPSVSTADLLAQEALKELAEDALRELRGL